MLSDRTLWRLMTGLAIIIAAYGIALLAVPAARPPFVQDLVASIPWAVYLHIAGSPLALGLGPFQFNAALRSRHLRLHRSMGRLYLLSVLTGGAAGFRLAWVSQGGAAAHIGFASLAALWIFTSARAYQRIRAGDAIAHRRWMIRSYSLTFAAVTLRVYLPLGLAVGVPFELAYPAIAWLAWVPNLIVAEGFVVTKGTSHVAA